jgi:formate dehydrogenase maturation protein FdhE
MGINAIASENHVRCPKCGSDKNVLALLTSYTRYFRCSSCDGRWQQVLMSPPATSAELVSASEADPRVG